MKCPICGAEFAHRDKTYLHVLREHLEEEDAPSVPYGQRSKLVICWCDERLWCPLSAASEEWIELCIADFKNHVRYNGTGMAEHMLEATMRRIDL